MEFASKTNRVILAVLAVVVGVFMVAVAPFLLQTSLERVIDALIKISVEKPSYASGVLIFSFLFPIYRGLIFIGGIMLILLAGPIARGKEWTYPVGLLAAAFPSMGGMFMMMPYVSFVDGFPLPMTVSLAGLTFFWAFILMRKADKWVKWAQMLALTFAGMLSTHALITGTGNMRMLLTRPDKPMYAGLGEWVLAWSAPIQWVCVILLLLSIYLIAARKFSGWWLALVAVVSLAAIDIPMQVIRLTMTSSTAWDYSYGLPMIIGLLFALLFPKFKAVLAGQEEM
ncbi:MAG: hypothetical protein JXR32_08135 [Anaerolineaceae bacterium]|nr:hypothetical protein [Anaerolineaceae bacterium]